MADIHLDSATTLETIDVTIEVDADPTAATPQFVLAAVGAAAPGSGWQDGSWVTVSAASAAGRRVATARTPTIGDAGTLVVASATRYQLWWRVTTLGETPVRKAAVIAVG